MDPSEPPAPGDEAKETASGDQGEETASVTERAKRWRSKRKKIIKGVGIAVVAVAVSGLALLLAKDYRPTDEEETEEPATSGMGFSGPEPADEQGEGLSPERPMSPQHVSGHLMKTNGQPSEAAKAAYAEAYAAGLVEEPEIPPGYTWRQDYERYGEDDEN
ncbi:MULTISPECIES: hypothetical protein [Streptomyces]|uniref:hypothetical protein n=1 Tax=Streptomyces TaxID=1883 RepID=UPI001673B253|nr:MULTISPECIES: hypothetical protein [Streptomyces]MBK3520291.1 hypothetical protein [Streptomyces sp. MBT70]GGS15093.1 hypothetical protein GCM10010236_81420 [Streptomyces eurythermus]